MEKDVKLETTSSFPMTSLLGEEFFGFIRGDVFKIVRHVLKFWVDHEDCGFKTNDIYPRSMSHDR